MFSYYDLENIAVQNSKNIITGQSWRTFRTCL